MDAPSLLRSEQREIIQAEWGELTWFASAALGNSQDMTVGQCVIKPGMSNPMHHHPNCSEVLHVLKGKIAHRFTEGAEAESSEGDTITIPANLPHCARNIGETDAVLLIAFSSAQRQVTGE